MLRFTGSNQGQHLLQMFIIFGLVVLFLVSLLCGLRGLALAHADPGILCVDNQVALEDSYEPASSAWNFIQYEGIINGSSSLMVVEDWDRKHVRDAAVTTGEEGGEVSNAGESEGLQWTIEVVDNDCGWSPSMVLDQDQIPRIAYSCGYAVMSDTQWLREPVPGIGGEVSLVLDGDDHPHTSFGNASLGYADFDGVDWTVETIESGGGGLGRNSALALDADGHPHITYYGSQPDPDPTDFRHAYHNGTRWVTETIASDAWGNGTGVSSGLLIDSKGDLHALYMGGDFFGDFYVTYAHFSGTAWITQVVAAGNAGSIAMASDGSLHVSFIEGNLVRYASRVGSEWVAQDVTSFRTPHSGLSPMGFGIAGATDIQVDSLGRPHIVFYNELNWDAGELCYARFNGAEWIVEAVDTQGTPGYGRLSLALDSSAQPHIAYLGDWADPELRYAHATMDLPFTTYLPVVQANATSQASDH